tara:strand:- start:4 stop:258 length:255 start_codon:yes stop_codon:yes gene_type:complete
MSVADKMSQAYLQGADDAKKQARQELEALRELCDDQARIIESMQKQAQRKLQLERAAAEDAQRKLESIFAEDESDVEQLSKQGR